MVVAAVLLTSGCDSNNTDSFEDAAPPVLSADAFSIDTNIFGASPKAQAGPNFAAAALRVWPVSTIISANLIIPTLVTAAAVQADPVYDDEWIWSSTATGEGGTIGFTLYATPGADGLDWSMNVSLTEGETVIADFELYRAQTALNGKSGSWQLFYEYEGTSTNVLRADFEVTDQDTKSILFTVVGGPFDNVGDSVEYRADGSAREFEWTEQSQSRSHLVVWDAVTRAGSITSTNFNGGVPSCWDTNLDDVACAG